MPKATINDKPILGGGVVAWPLREGTKPVIQTFEMAPLDAINVATSGGPVTLKITPEEGNEVVVRGLFVLNIQPGDSPYISKITLADLRVWWSYPCTKRSFNVRRNVGTKRLFANDQVPQVNPIASKVAYHPATLNKARPFEPLSMLQNALKRLEQHNRENGYGGFQVIIDDRIGSKLSPLPVEGVLLDDTGDQALDRVLSYLPEAMVYVDYDAVVIVTSRATGDEKKVIQALMPEIVDEGHTDLVQNRLIRPREIHVLFTREVELRFDFTEQRLAVGTISVDPPDSRTLQNVLPSPDYQLEVADGVPGDKAPVCQGTWLNFDEAFNYWGTLPRLRRNGSARKLDHDLIQRAFIPQMDLWAAIGMAGERPNDAGELRDWMARIVACQNHYRMTFRISAPFMDRILSIRAYRATTADPVSKTRSPALAYGDYCILPTQRMIWKNIADKKPMDYAINKTAYPTTGILDATAEPSPCDVEVVDSDQGIIRLNYKSNPIYGANETILPSQMAGDAIPTADITNRFRPVSFDTVLRSGNPPRLSPSYQMAVVLTAVPAAPNTNDQLHRIVVKPGDISGMLPDSQTAGLEDARGPVMEIRIGAGVEVARVAWNDARRVDIEKIFGLPEGAEGAPNLQGLVINEDATGDLRNGASLNAIAKAAAARIYASLVDRFEGGMTGHMNGQVRPAGWLSEVRHELRQDGETVTVLEMPPQIPQLSLFGWLDSATRQSVLGLVQPEK